MPETPVPIGRRCLLGWANFWSMLAHCLPYDDSTTDPRASAAAYASTDIARTQNLGSHNYRAQECSECRLQRCAVTAYNTLAQL